MDRLKLSIPPIIVLDGVDPLKIECALEDTLIWPDCLSGDRRIAYDDLDAAEVSTVLLTCSTRLDERPEFETMAFFDGGENMHYGRVLDYEAALECHAEAVKALGGWNDDKAKDED